MKNIAMKMVKVMQECAYVQKQGFNAFNKYKYASAANVLEKVNDALTKNNVASFVTPKLISFTDVTTNTGKAEHLATVEATILLVDADSGESITVVGLGSGQDNGDKGVMKAQTAAIKYAWMLTLNISTGDDPEADNGVDERMYDKIPLPKVFVPPAPLKPVTAPPAHSQTSTDTISIAQVKSLSAKSEKEGLTGKDLYGMLKWKFHVEQAQDLKIGEFAACMNSMNIIWSDYVLSQSKPA